MAYTRDMFDRAREIINARREENEAKAEARRSAFETMEPDYIKWKREQIAAAAEVIRAIELSPERAQALLEEQKNRSLGARSQIAALLKKNGLPEDYLDVQYTCPACEDTGIVGTHLCACQIELLKKLAFDEAGRRSPLKFCRFEDFRLDYYDTAYNEQIKCSPREHMEYVLSFCKEYAESFDINSQNILMYGETGLGKTHLSLAIAGEVIEKGFHVIYNSAQNIFNELQRERFGKGETDGQYEAMLLECDLLVIDDLGAEFSTSFTDAALYNIINTRINTSLPTVISTNLNLKALEERYSRRISSRLIGEYVLQGFVGADVRQIKKAER